MSLAPGTRIGAYEITSQLGAGGMGEVYRAKDSKLKREVALKVLPADVANDRERMARFQREAEVLASLNHPNIAHIHGLEDANGTTALVMELVEGEDLAERLKRGPIPVDEALPIAKEIAGALEAAHEQGIIHRDLKPANVKVRPDGTVKVLDFGLAKALDQGSGIGGQGSGTLENSPTITSPAMTMRGMILGTAAYMAPEQAKGKAVDKRADIWAFGCVLYEMLAGKRAFQGEDVSDTLAAVLRGDPDWALLPASLPPAWLSLIKRCLERDPRRRIAAMSTVRFVLEEPSTNLALPPAATGRSGSRTPLRLAIAVAVLASLAAGYTWMGTRPASSPITRFSFVLPEGQMLTMGRRMLAVAPDGREFVYLAGNRLYVRRFSEFDAMPISATDLGGTLIAPAYSPDGLWIAFHSATERSVKRVSAQGGVATRVCETESGPLSIEWDASGILLGMGPRGIGRCSPGGGNVEVLLRPATADETLLGPQILPGGDAILFTVAKVSDGGARRWDRAQVVVQSLGTGQRTPILDGARDARLLPTGHLLYTAGGVVYAAPADPATAQLRGDAVPVVDGVRRSTGGAVQLAFSPAGTLAYISGPAGGAAGLQDLSIGDRNGVVSKVPLPAGAYSHVRVSPDGRRLAIAVETNRDAYVLVYPLDGAHAPQRLTLAGQSRFPVWSGDGRWLSFASERDGTQGIFRQRADGSGAAERLTAAAAGEEHIPETWSPDDRVLLFAVRAETPGQLPFSLWMRTADGKTSPVAGVRSIEQTGAMFSPDGRWFAYALGEGESVGDPNRGVFVRPFPPTGAVYQAPKVFVDFHPVWTAGGNELVYSASGTAGLMAAAKVSRAGGITFGEPAQFPATVTGDRLSPEVRGWDVLPDGRLIGITPASDGATRRTLAEVRVVVNWFDELRQRVPLK